MRWVGKRNCDEKNAIMDEKVDAKMDEINSEEEFARKAFQKFYERSDPASLNPGGISEREFGVGSWSRKIDNRHLSFRDEGDLRSFLVRNTPFYVSYSAAYYEFPEARPMPRKNWKGADLIFDLDADHLPLACVKEGKHQKGWVCGNCISQVKDETLKLIEEFLMPDFGFSEKEISVNFSGNRGFHVHVQGEAVRNLSNYARRELVDYITGTGLQVESIFFRKQVSKLEGPKPGDAGWFGKVASRFTKLLREGNVAELRLDEKLARRLGKGKDTLLAGIVNGNWDVVRMSGPEKEQLQRALVGYAAVQLRDEIDTGVTFDVSKLIRLPNSLHGETGLVAKRLKSYTGLSGFNPFDDAVALSDGAVRVKCKDVPEFEMKGRQFGPYGDETAELPEFAAVYLIGKRMATLA